MVRLIHNLVWGRARYNIRGLRRCNPLKEYLEERISKTEGINSFRINILTGNILVLYNSSNTAKNIGAVINSYVCEFQNHKDSSIVCKVKKDEKGNSKEYFVPEQKSSDRTFLRRDISRRKLRRSVINSQDQISHKWHLMESGEVLRNFGVNKNTGLTLEEAAQNLKKYGLNVLPEAVPRSRLSIFIDQLKSMPVALLSIAAGISLFTGGLADAFVIMGVVIINAVIGYVTESHAEKTIHSLKNLVRPTAFVLRENKIMHIGAENIVLGDILLLRPGCYVAADARLLESQHLSIDESLLTGESMPVLKTPFPLKINPNVSDIPLAERYNMVYMGTLVTGGQGIAVVTATGRFTEIGKIQTLIGNTKTQETPMERQLSELGTQLVILSSFICLGIFFIGLLRGYGLLQMVKTAISLAVAAVPEGLPTVATTTLSLGIRNMRRYNVLIRRLNAVETLGSVQTICLDKTGTLTMNKMSVVLIYSGMKRIKVSDGKFEVIDPGIQDTKRAKGSYPLYSLLHSDELLKLINICVLCSESEIRRDINNYVVNGSPTENALIHLAISSGIDVVSLREKFPLLGIKHRSEKANYMVTAHDVSVIKNNRSCPKILAIKGSPLEVLSLCNFYMVEGKKIPLSEEDRLRIEFENERMAGDALRVLGVAYTFIDEKTIEDHNLSCFKGNGSDAESISELLGLAKEIIWLGLICISDPIKDGVKELIGRFHKAGIDTIMITGDQGPTAYAIGKELNLSNEEPLEILDSTHLSDIKPEVLMALCSKVRVFSRASPAHKLQIVQALQATGRVVAMTGDGINDGPALKAADIGIAMGQKGTDVAREVADVVLEDDRLETMIIAIKQGRTIYNNIRKSVHYLLSTNLSEILVMFGAIALGLGQPLSAMQLLWINLISDIAPGLALALEPPEPDVLNNPPRDPNEPIIKSDDFRRIAFESAMISAGALTAYGYGIAKYGISAAANTMAFMSLSIGQILHSISCRSRKNNILFRGELSHNKYLTAAIGCSLTLQALVMLVPGLRSLLGISKIGFIDSIVIGCSAITPLLVNEVTKSSN